MRKKLSLVLCAIVLMGLFYIPAQAALEYSAPIRITKGGTYSGNYRSTNHQTAAITVDTEEPVIIENCNIISRGNAIRIEWGADVTVRNCSIKNENPLVEGVAMAQAVSASEPTNFVFEHNYVEDSWGVYVYKFRGDGTDGTIKIRYNQFLNTEGRRSNGPEGGFSNENRTLAHAVQLNQVWGSDGQGVKNMEVSWNQFINEPYNSSSEDVINFYRSSGTPDSPLRCHNNYIYGAYAPDPATMDYSGGGILTDGNKTDEVNPHDVWIYENIVTATSNYGVSLASGKDNRIFDNIAIGCGKLEDGTVIYGGNVGSYVWNPYENPGFANNITYGNTIGWNGRPHGEFVRNDTWYPHAANENPHDEQTFIPGGTDAITFEFEKSFYETWQQRLAENNISIGLSSPLFATDLGFGEGNTVEIFNNSGNDLDAKVYVTVSDDKQKLVRHLESGELPCKQGETATFTFGDPDVRSGIYTYRCFYWDENLQPLSKGEAVRTYIQ